MKHWVIRELGSGIQTINPLDSRAPDTDIPIDMYGDSILRSEAAGRTVRPGEFVVTERWTRTGIVLSVTANGGPISIMEQAVILWSDAIPSSLVVLG